MKRTIAERVNHYLAEPPDAQFVNGKWKFWFVCIAFLSIINAALTWLIFRDDSENYSGPIMLSVGALVAWLCVGALHYSYSSNRQLARGVSAVDSIALLFVVVHFSGLLYVYGHHRTLRSAEARYEQAAVKYNDEAKQISTDNVAIAQAAQAIARENTKQRRLESDAAFQLRKAAEANRGVLRSAPRPAPDVAPALSTSAVELERPVKPTESSAAFLTKWDWLIRAANCGELLLACLTLILIRNVSAKTNAPVENFRPIGLESSTGVYRSPIPTPAFRTAKKETRRTIDSFDSAGAQALRDALKDISFRLKGYSFKVTIKPNCVWIMMVEANQGTQQTVASCRCDLTILRDAETMPRDKFRAKLELTLKRGGFEI